MKPKFSNRPHYFGQIIRFVGVAAAGILTAQAGNTWTGTTNQDWNTASNWGGALPTTSAITINTATGNTPIISTTVARNGGDTFIGNAASGKLDINSGGSLSTSTKWLFVGQGTNGNGTLNVNSGGTLTSDNDLRLGINNSSVASGVGQLNVNGGTVTLARVVSANTTSGVSVSNGGKLTTTSAGNTNGSSNLYRLTTSNFTDGSLVSVASDARYGPGSSSIAGGSVSAAAQVMVGSSGNTTTLDISSGSLASASWMVVGIDNSSNGTINLSGTGTVNATTGVGSTAFTTIGANGNAVGVINQTGGTWNQGGVGIVLGEGGTGSGTYNLGGGLLKTPRLYKGTGSSGIVNFNGGTLQPTATNDTNFLTGLTAANVRDGGAKINTNGFNITVGQALVHSSIGGDSATDGGLTKSGAGILTLSGTNTYTGATTVNGGTLQLSGSGASNSSSGINLTGGGKLKQNSSVAISTPVTLSSGALEGSTTVGAVTVADSASNSINGSAGALLTIGSLTFNDAASLNLNISPTSSAAVINAGTLTTGAVNGSGKVTVNATAISWNSGVYDLISYGGGSIAGAGFSEFQKGSITGLSNRQTATLSDTGSVIALTIAGDNPSWAGTEANGDWTTTSTQNWYLTGQATTTDFLAGDIVTFDDSASSGAVNIAGANVSPLSTLFKNTSTLPYTISSVNNFGIAGAGSVALIGGGSVTLNTANTYSGGTTVNAGTLNINNASAIGTGTLTLAEGVSIDNTSGAGITLSTNNVQTWNGATVNFLGSNDLNLGTGAIALAANTTINAGGSATLGLGGAISGAYGLTKSGSGTVSLAGANTYTGAVTVNAGTLSLSGANAFTGAVTVNAGKLLVATGGSVANTTLSAVKGTSTLEIDGGSFSTTSGGQAWSSSLDVGTNGGDNATVNIHSGSLTTSKQLTLGNAGANATYNQTGGTTTVGGFLAMGLGGSTAVINQSGGSMSSAFGTVGAQTGGTSTVNLSGTASYTHTGAAGSELWIGEAGTAVLNLADTALFSHVNSNVILGKNAGSFGTLNLNGGTVLTKSVTKGAGTGTLSLNGGTLKASAASSTFLQGMTTATVQAGGAWIDSNGFAITIGQALAGSGDLNKSGAGTLTLSGANTYSGATNINAGTLSVTGSVGAVNVTNGTLSGTGSVGAVTVADGVGNVVANGSGAALTLGSLALNGAATLNATVSAAGSAGLVVTNALTTNGSVTLNATNSTWNNGETYTLVSYSSLGGNGFSDIHLGTVSGKSPRQIPALSDTGSAITLSFTGDVPVWSGATSSEWGGTSNWQLQAGGTTTDYVEADNVLFNDTATGSTSVTIVQAGVSPTSTTFDNSTKDYSLTSAGTVGIATGTLTKSGTGSLTLASANTYAGGTTLNGGTLNLNAASAIGTGALTINGGNLGNTSGADVALGTNGAQNWNGDFAYISNNNLDLGSGAVTLGGQGTTRTVNVTGGILAAGEVTGAAMGLTKLGIGTLVFKSEGTGANASHLAGDLDVQEGTVQFNATGATGGTATANTGDLYVAGLIGSGTVTNGAGQERWLYLNNAGDSTFAGTLANGNGGGALALIKAGAGAQTLTGNNTYTARTTVKGGTLNVTGSIDAQGVAGGQVIVGDTADATAILNLSGTIATPGEFWVSSAANAHSTFNMTAGSVTTGSWFVVGRGGNDGNFNMSGGTLDVGANGNFGIASWGGNLGVVTVTGGTITTVNNAYVGEGGTGTLSISGTGSLVVNGTEGLRVASNSGSTGTVNLGTGGTITAKLVGSAGTSTFNFDGGSLKAGAASATFMQGLTAAHVLANGATLDDNGFAITVAQAFDGVGGVTKVGTGVTTLSGANTYAGATSVNAGTLNVTGSLAAGSAVTVAQGATLGGSGTIAGTVSGYGVVAPGVAGAGTLATGEVTVAGSLAIEVDGAVADKVASTGAVHLSGALSVTELAGGFTEASYVIAEGASLDGTFSSVPQGYSVAYTGTSATLTKTSGADTTAPVITLSGNSTVTVEAGTSYTDAGATATDDVDSSVTVNTTGSVNTAVPGTYTLTYSATDNAGNQATAVTRTVTVSDTTAPVITRNGNATVSLVAGGSYTDAGATATDSLDGSVTVSTSGSVNTAVAGTYTLTYSATDAAGNQATQVTRTVTVTAPTFSDWASGYSLTGANAAADADPDKDGIKNSVEYVLGGNPTVSDAATIAPTGAKSGSNYVYTFKRTDVSEANTTVSVEYGNNLSGWTSYSVGATTSSPVVVTENDTAADTVVVTIPNAGAAKFFARLKVIVP